MRVFVFLVVCIAAIVSAEFIDKTTGMNVSEADAHAYKYIQNMLKRTSEVRGSTITFEEFLPLHTKDINAANFGYTFSVHDITQTNFKSHIKGTIPKEEATEQVKKVLEEMNERYSRKFKFDTDRPVDVKQDKFMGEPITVINFYVNEHDFDVMFYDETTTDGLSEEEKETKKNIMLELAQLAKRSNVVTKVVSFESRPTTELPAKNYFTTTVALENTSTVMLTEVEISHVKNTGNGVNADLEATLKEIVDELNKGSKKIEIENSYFPEAPQGVDGKIIWVLKSNVKEQNQKDEL
jgi:hypothetical protein